MKNNKIIKNSTCIKQNNNRKSESQAIWKSYLFEKESDLLNKIQGKSPHPLNTENPSLDTIKRSLSQINLNNQRRTYQKRFLSKPSLSISRVNSSAYYNRKGTMTKSKRNFNFLVKLINSNNESLRNAKLKKKNRFVKDKIKKPHTIQHKSSKGILKRLRSYSL